MAHSVLASDAEPMCSRDSQAWVAALRGPTAMRDEATAELHALLLRGARFKLTRVRHTLDGVSSEALDSLAIEAADAALGDVLAGLDDFRGTSRFTTWASKFVLREAGVRLRQVPARRTLRGVFRRD
jgi:RNA polymerase sigma-70 factor, ECF subfamily